MKQKIVKKTKSLREQFKMEKLKKEKSNKKMMALIKKEITGKQGNRKIIKGGKVK